MARRRQETERRLAGSTDNPMGMAPQFNLRSSAPQVVSGVQNVNAPQARVDDTGLQVLQGLAEFGSRKIREAAKTRYETLMLDGAMAYQQGKSVDELELDGNKWMLEGYQTMEAETVSSALYSAQEAEITQGLYEADPDTFRQRYTSRLEEALAGKDERTQDLIRRKMAEQMPALVEQHTREHAAYLQRRNADALSMSVDVISRDPSNTQSLIDFATGKSTASQGLGEEQRRKAVVEGVVRAYTNNNPLAYTILDQQGVFESFLPEEINAIRSAQGAYESRKRSEFDEAFMLAEQNLITQIQQGEVSPEKAVQAYSKLMQEHGMTMTASEANNVFATSYGANSNHNRAVAMEVETAKLNGDFTKVGELTYNYAQDAANPATPGRVYDYQIPVQYSMGPKRPNKPRNEIVSVIAASAEEVLGPTGRVVVTSGQENEGEQHGAPRHKTGMAADVAFYRADGTQVMANDPEMLAIAEAAARRGATGIGFGEEYMGGAHAHIDLVGTSAGGGNVWASGAKANADRLVATMQSATRGTSLGDIDAEKWKTVVKQFNGDVELAAVAYTMGSEAARTWDETGRRTADLDPDVAGFVDRIGGHMQGRAYQTAETRVAQAQQVLEITRQRTAVDAYAAMTPKLEALDNSFVAGAIDETSYRTQRQSIMAAYGAERTTAEIDHILNMSDQRLQRAQAIVKETADAQYATNLEIFAGKRYEGDVALKAAIDAIGTMVRPEGATDAEFAQAQADARDLALKEYNSFISREAAALGIKPQDSAIGDTITQIVDATTRAALKAQENAQLNATAARAARSGTLNTADPAVQDMAWKQAQQNIASAVQQQAATVNADQNMPAAEKQQAIADFEKAQYENFFAQANYVPQQMRDEASAMLNGRLVQEDGTVSPAAFDTIIAYRDLKAKSSTAAMQLLDDKARTVADAVLAYSGGNEAAIPRIMQDMWAKGLGNPLMGKPDHVFAERGMVTNAINEVLGPTRFQQTAKKLLGTYWMQSQTPVQQMGLSDSDRAIVGTMLRDQVQKLHELNPNLSPEYLTGVAEQNVLRQIAPVKPSIGADLFSSQQPGVIVDASGGDLMGQFFGGKADQYASDRMSINNAIAGYVKSPEFKSKYQFDPTPSVGLMTYLYESIPGVADDLSTAASAGDPIFQVQHAGNGLVYLNFRLDDEGREVSQVVPMSEIGEWYMKNDIKNIIK